MGSVLSTQGDGLFSEGLSQPRAPVLLSMVLKGGQPFFRNSSSRATKTALFGGASRVLGVSPIVLRDDGAFVLMLSLTARLWARPSSVNGEINYMLSMQDPREGEVISFLIFSLLNDLKR